MDTFSAQQAYVGETWPRNYTKWHEGETWRQIDSEWQGCQDLKEHNLPSSWLGVPWCQSTSSPKASIIWGDGCHDFNVDSDASTAVSTEASLTSWNIVWCSERCYKAENDERRERLSELAQSAGATLVLHKKAQKLAAWLAKAQQPPYILLTDWREAKPSLQATAREPVHNQPVFSLVLCDDDEKAYERAKQWMEELPPRTDPVHVMKESGLNIVKQFLDNLSEKSPSSDTSTGNFGCGDDDGSSASSPRSSIVGTANRLPLIDQSMALSLQQDLSIASCSEVDGDDEHATRSQTSGIDGICRETSWLETMRNSVLPEVSDVLSNVLQNQTPAEVVALLEAAQPDFYDV